MAAVAAPNPLRLVGEISSSLETTGASYLVIQTNIRDDASF
jgi:hypothetical protein